MATGDSDDAEVMAAFAAHDRDASGGIDASELVSALSRLGLSASSQQAQRVLAKYDSDGSRQLELAEFRQLVADLKVYQAGGGGDQGVAAKSTDHFPRLLHSEELLSMVYGF